MDDVPMINGAASPLGYALARVVPCVNRTRLAMADEVNEQDSEYSPEDLRAELKRILASTEFEASDRNRRFLSYVIEETLAGRASRIKAYNIATDVFGRDGSFDPQLDPVVRMEARRLRRSLERFYLMDRHGGRLRITLPKGGYVPEFQKADTLDGSGVMRTPRPGDHTGTSIYVARFDSGGDESAFFHFSHGFTDQLMIGLSKYEGLSIYGPPVSESSGFTGGEAVTGQDYKAEYLLLGSTSVFENILNVKAILVLVRTGQVLWGQTIDRRFGPGTLLKIRDDIADTIVRAVADPYGVIFTHQSTGPGGFSFSLPRTLNLGAHFDQYRRSYRRDMFYRLRLGIEQELVSNPEDCEALACLSLLYSDAHRFGFASSEPPFALKTRAGDLARRAVDLDPTSARAHHAMGLAHWHLNEVPASVAALQTATALNRESPEIIADLGLVWSLRAEWGRAVPLLEEAKRRSAMEGNASSCGLSLFNFANRRYESALADAAEINAPDVAHGFAMRAISQIRLGKKSEAEASIEHIMALGTRVQGGLTELGGRSIHPELACSVVEALRDAGLPPQFIQQ